MATLRDARYAVPFIVLIGVIAVSTAFARVQSTHTTPTLDRSIPAMAPLTTVVTQRTLSLDDARRATDLSALRGLLETYRSRNGTYPTTESYTTTLCTTAWDAGCLLISVSSHLTASDGSRPYWYRSDGASYTLFASVDAPPDHDDCPPQLPPALAGSPILCMNFPGGPH